MPKGGHKQVSEAGNSDTPTDLKSRFFANLRELILVYQNFSSVHGFDTERFPASKPMSMYLEWLKVDSDVYETDILAGNPSSQDSENRPKSETVRELLSTWDVYSDLSFPWRLRFSEKAYGKFKDFDEEKSDLVLGKMFEFAAGRIEIGKNCSVLGEGPFKHMVSFSSKVIRDLTIVFAFELNKIPVFARNRLEGFDFHHFLRVVDIVKDQENAVSSVKQYLSFIRTDPAKQILPEGDDFRDTGKTVSFQNSTEELRPHFFGPKKLFPQVLSEAESAQYSYDLYENRWVLESTQVYTSRREIEIIKSNASLISELADSESCKLLIQFLQQKKRAFPFEASPEELDVIGTPGNVLVVGRSGTGKTSCAMLKLLSSDALYRFRLKQQGLTNAEMMGLHIVFVTASPTLTIEVKRKYEDLVQKLKSKKKDVKNAEIDEKTEEEMNENDLHIKSSMSLMTHSDFPLFSTYRLLVLAIDSSLKNPCFKPMRNAETVVQAGFVTELLGVKVLSHSVKAEDLAEDHDFQADSDEEKQAESISGESGMRTRKRKRVKDVLTGEENSFEVDFAYFQREFYIEYQRTNFSAAVVWAEIIGKIKGAASAFQYIGGHLPKEVYMTVQQKSNTLTDPEMEEIWTFFIRYEKWKRRIGAYDFQDVVNHALREVTRFGYFGVPIHYMLIDEVQDFSHAAVLLFSKITENSVFLSGDTAQAIAKESVYRFKDLQTVFASHENFKIEPPVIKPLLHNYRCHDLVLNIANCVVRIIELLFPKTIDFLGKEVGNPDISAPIPIVLKNADPDEIATAIVMGEAFSRRKMSFGSGQVVLVPTVSARDRVPDLLKGAVCLTIYESKGLEFDDVILFDFFENCGVEEKEWKVLTELLFVDRDDTQPADICSDTWQPKFLSTFESGKYSSLCTALKMFYVAVTRTKRKLIIYNVRESAQPLLTYLERTGMTVSTVPDINSLFGDVTEVADTEETRVLWRNQGVKMMKLKYYLQAGKCFQYANEEILLRKAKTLHLADEAGNLLLAGQAGNRRGRLEGSEKIRKAKEMFEEAAMSFLDLKQRKYAAQCFFSAELYQRAVELYEELQAWNQLGECYSMTHDYLRSAQCFLHIPDYKKALEAYDKGEMWEACFLLLGEHPELITGERRLQLLCKYCERTVASLAEPTPNAPRPHPSNPGKEVCESTQLPSSSDIGKYARPRCHSLEFDRPIIDVETQESFLSTLERESLLLSYSANMSFFLDLDEDLIDKIEESYSRSKGHILECSYSCFPNLGLETSPEYAPIVSSTAFFAPEVINKILFFAKMLAKEESGDAVPMFDLMNWQQQVVFGMRLFQKLGMEKLAFVLANTLPGDLPAITDYLETQCVEISPIHLIKANELYRGKFPKLGKYWSAVATRVLHKAFELLDAQFVLQQIHSNVPFLARLLFLGFWKKVVGLADLPHALATAAAFADFHSFKKRFFVCAFF